MAFLSMIFYVIWCIKCQVLVWCLTYSAATLYFFLRKTTFYTFVVLSRCVHRELLIPRELPGA